MNDNTENQNTTTEEAVVDVNDLIAERRRKLTELREQGNAYPNAIHREHWFDDLITEHESKSKEDLETAAIPVNVAGRIMTRRIMGKASFCHLQDMSGKLQAYIRKNDLPEGAYDNFKTWDLGDIIHVTGKLFKTKTGELSIWADSIRLVTKSLQPFPDKYHGLVDLETRYRQRYVDLMVNAETRETFRIRSQLISGIRQYLNQRRFMEVETPMMHPLVGGAAAKPFNTHHNTLDMPLFMRIAPELYLKRLVVGGFERVYEINRNFRNEGLSTQHNPEFTMLEFYQAYATYEDLMTLTEDMFRTLANDLLGTAILNYQDHEIDFSKGFVRMTVLESIVAYNPDINIQDLQDFNKAKAIAEHYKIEVKPEYGLGKIQIEIFEKIVEHRLIKPTFITAYPTEISPLARRSNDDPTITDRFELFIAGREIANGFSELNDPDDQAERFQKQVEAKAAGDDEAMSYDEDYITALEYGMPPTAGEGIGIDRLAMLFTDSASIRDVILFPLLRKANS